MKIHCGLFVALQIAIPSIILSWIHANMWGFSLSSICLIWFIVINLLICVWEAALFYCFPALRKEHERREKLGFYKNTQEGRAVRNSLPLILFRSYELSELCRFEFWVHIWTEYCRYDDAYAHQETFQYNIDVGNAHSTPLSCLIFLISMFIPMFSPQVVGLIGCLLFYQKFYGTCIYLFVFFNCNKGKHLTQMELILCVLSTNGTWILGPMLGFYKGYLLVTTGTFDAIN
jgi:hypothetical protein